MEEKLTCQCCGYLTLIGIFDICPVCGWQEDKYQQSHPDDAYGPNHVSFNQSIINYKTFGAANREFLERARKPLPEEMKNKE